MKTITVEVYEFNELDEKAKEVARSYYRGREYITSDDYECVTDDAKHIGELLGLSGEIHWSGFGAQGSGACWTGAWYAKNVSEGKTKEWAPKDEELHIIASAIESMARLNPCLNCTITQHGRYSHEYSVFFEFESGLNAGINVDVTETMTDALRRFMKWIYSQLESQNTYLYSDEGVDEAIKGQENWGFTKEGKRRMTL